ncbi:MAG: C_GCAxxG_C_C family protein [Erysipelotrichaceae bacterium]|nr:C_GCAxxG_C_C family protein [Erysipelotrichaceae bacterium]
MDRKEKAVELKHNGYNCAQAVLCVFKEETGLSEESLKRMGAGFGVGMGCMEATCGALIAAEILMGLKEYQGKPVLRNARELYQAFTEKCGASICKDLKGRDTGKAICECDDCVRYAVELAEELYDSDQTLFTNARMVNRNL